MASISITNTFSNGTTADAGEVNTNFTDVANATSDGTIDFSIGALTVSGTLTANGAVNLGNSSGDDITVTGSLASSIPIKTDSTYDIGSTTLGLRSLYLTANSNSVRVMADASASADWTFFLPPDAGTNGYGLQTSGSGAHVYAPMQTDINAVSGDYTVTDTDGYRHIHVTTSTTDRTITLPTAADNTDRMLSVLKVDSDSGTVTIDGEGAETINGASNFILTSINDKATIVCDGSGWYVVSSELAGTYTPTASNLANITSSSVQSHMYSRVGRIVTVSGSIAGTVTTTNTLTTFDITLPIPTANFSSSDQARGVLSSSKASAAINDAGLVSAVSSAQRVQMSIRLTNFPNSTTAVNFAYTFQYEIQ